MGNLIVISIDGIISLGEEEGWFTHWSFDSMTESVFNWHDMSLGYIFSLGSISATGSTWEFPAQYLDVSSTWQLECYPYYHAQYSTM